MKILATLLLYFAFSFVYGQQKQQKNVTQQNKPTLNQKNNSPQKEDKKNPIGTKANVNKVEKKEPQKVVSKPKPKEPEPPKEPDYSYIKIDTTCPRCKGYKHDRACDGLYCYSGACSTCKGYKKCIRCAGTQMRNVGLEGCPDCTDGKCRTCKGSGLCAKCEGTGKLICLRCGGTGSKTPEQIETEKLKKIEDEKRKFEERERKRLYGFK